MLAVLVVNDKDKLHSEANVFFTLSLWKVVMCMTCHGLIVFMIC